MMDLGVDLFLILLSITNSHVGGNLVDPPPFVVLLYVCLRLFGLNMKVPCLIDMISLFSFRFIDNLGYEN